MISPISQPQSHNVASSTQIGKIYPGDLQTLEQLANNIETTTNQVRSSKNPNDKFQFAVDLQRYETAFKTDEETMKDLDDPKMQAMVQQIKNDLADLSSAINNMPEKDLFKLPSRSLAQVI